MTIDDDVNHDGRDWGLLVQVNLKLWNCQITKGKGPRDREGHHIGGSS